MSFHSPSQRFLNFAYRWRTLALSLSFSLAFSHFAYSSQPYNARWIAYKIIMLVKYMYRSEQHFHIFHQWNLKCTLNTVQCTMCTLHIRCVTYKGYMLHYSYKIQNSNQFNKFECEFLACNTFHHYFMFRIDDFDMEMQVNRKLIALVVERC